MVNVENSKTLKYIFLKKKTVVLSIICSKYFNQDGKIHKEEESTVILKILVLMKYI